MVFGTVRDNPAQHRYELDVDGFTAAAYYRREPGVIVFTHTEVPSEIGGRGVASKLTRQTLEIARADGLKVKAPCPFVSAYMARHREYDDLVL
jgi:predicted GNAT family acetyltransferase